MSVTMSTRGRLLYNVCQNAFQQVVRGKATQAAAAADIKPFYYQDIMEFENKPDVPFKKLTGDYVSTFEVKGKKMLHVEPEALTMLAEQAMIDIAHLLRPGHLQQLSNILKDPESSNNDKFVALELLKNANIAAGMILPGCQDTGTAICMGKKGQYVWTEGRDEEAISRGIYNTYTKRNLRYSQVAPVDMYKEVNTKTNLPAQIEIYATNSNQYDFLFLAKGGGSANKTFLFQQTKALLNPEKLLSFTLGTAACPPYHLALVIGGTSAEYNLKTVKLASCRYLDTLPTSGNEHGRAFRDLQLEQEIHKLTQKTGIGAQFGGKYFCHDVRVIRLPRHGASCPVGIGVSCSADRQAVGKITNEGVFLEQLETNPSKYLPEIEANDLGGEVVQVDLNRPMGEVLKQLSGYPIKTRLSLSGTLVVARDIAHAKLQERLNNGDGLPQYFKDHPVYYAGPAKTPQVTNACKNNGGFYLGSIGGPAAILAQNCIKKVEILEYPELGMEAIWKVEVENFPAFIVVDNKGNDFFKEWQVE
ncbi:hypothetical protein KUTeg_002661 [Tegillarca granosa]|uniref:fumarate hydratase n=1 Tax=Tegillarca granosa TaxID=220873 RepID=A0ABQ9FV25_TEGGR|nr:hypothetical protein KUTeg_002661 [Tegillarca granosa]